MDNQIEAEKWYELSKSRLSEALGNEALQLAVARATTVFSMLKNHALRKLQDLPHLRERAKQIKSWSISHLNELISMLKENIEALGGVFYLAKDASELNDYVSKICLDHGAKLIVKSKSMVTEETRLNDALMQKGLEVIETDLGERIIQLLGERPSHMIAPAIHIPREKAAELFSRVANRRIRPKIPEIVQAARESLREKFVNADIGISGANVISAETGTIFILENEGNARFVTNAPPVHICITGIEKIVPRLEDAMVIIRLIAPYASGQIMTSYVSLITGPSRTADIELTAVVGAHGPKELHLVLLDNGRTEMIRDPDFREAAYCIRCGSCLNECPVFCKIGGHAMGYVYTGGIGAIFTAFYHGFDKSWFSFLCSQCGACQNACPLNLDIPRMIQKLRCRLVKLGYIPPPHTQIGRYIEQYGNPFGESMEKRWSG